MGRFFLSLIALIVLTTSPAWADIEQPSLVPPGLEAPVAARLAGERVQLVTQLNALLARLSAHNSSCTQVRSDDSARIQQCQASQARFSADLASYRAALAVYESHVRAGLQPPARTYRHSGNGLIGGATWAGGYYVPVDASPEVRERAMQRFREQASTAGIDPASIDFARYNFILGIAAAPELLWDLRRLFGDQLNEGRFSAENREAYASLRGRQFNELGCHSNGAMICLEALYRGDARADDVVLYGPQITQESLELWQELAAQGRIQSLRIYVNENDPVAPGAMIFSPSASISVRSRPIMFDAGALRRTIHEISPRAEVFTFACGHELTLNCHYMEQYTANRGCLRPQPPGEVEGTLFRGRRVREPPSPVCAH